MTLNEQIVACARGWVGTRFHHQGRLKKTIAHKGGVDCLGLLVGVAKELQLPLANLDRTDYSHTPDCDNLRKVLGSVLKEIPAADMQPGDIVLMRIDGRPQHLGIASDIGMIHAYAPARAVVEHALDEWWRSKIEVVFSV